jgi:hypothetical protein
LKVPKGKEGEFSQTNWGDFEVMERGKLGPAKSQLKRRATLFKNRIDHLTEEHWKAIMDGARHYTGKKKGVAREEVKEDIEMVASDEADDDGMLYDPMFA